MHVVSDGTGQLISFPLPAQMHFMVRGDGLGFLGTGCPISLEDLLPALVASNTSK